MHAFPAADPLPVARVALAALDDLVGELTVPVGEQRGHDRRDLGVGRDAFFSLFQVEALLDEFRVEVPGQESVRLEDALMERDQGRLNSSNSMLVSPRARSAS